MRSQASSAIMKCKKTNTLKQLLTIKLSEVGYWELNEMLGSGGFLRQKKLIGCLKWVINFYISEVKQKEEPMAKEQSQKEVEVFQIDEIGRGKGIEKTSHKMSKY